MEHDYRLSCQLVGHQEDVRSVCVCSSDGSLLATGSRDKTVRLWRREDDGFKLVRSMTGHQGFVGPVAWIPPSSEAEAGSIVSGGIDALVIRWDMGSSQPAETLRGHELQVSSLAVDGKGDIYSASIDRTVRRWRGGKTIEILNGHTAPVQAILLLPDDLLVTGSTDTSIKLWRGSRCLKTIQAHSDTVRGLAAIPGLGFISASHDGTLKTWSMDGEELLNLVGHTSLVYSVATNATSDVVASGSEDNSVRIWIGAHCRQLIEHPGCVWSVDFLPNGDLVTACSDGVARVWTRDPARFASPDLVEAYHASLVARRNDSGPGGVKVDALPGVELLQRPGATNGQTKVVREEGVAMAYSWNALEFKWEKIGEVVGGPDPAANANASHDYLFDVDIGNGDVRKLPYNRGESPYDVAARWLQSEGLPSSYTGQIVDFILRNAGTEMNRVFDPYTGGNAYVPGNPQAPKKEETVVLKYTPRVELASFHAVDYAKVTSKISALNDAIEGDVRLTEQEVEKLQAVITTLKDTQRYNNSQLSDADLSIFITKLLKWPLESLFPVLDLLRMLVLHPSGALFVARHDLLPVVLNTALSEPSLSNNVFLCVRLLVNCFRRECFSNWLLGHQGEIFDHLLDCKRSSVKAVRNAYVHLLLNYAIRLILVKSEEGPQVQVMAVALEVAQSEEDAELKFLALQTIATLVHSGAVKNVVKDVDITDVVVAAKASAVSKLAQIGAELDYLLR